jgi:hypothetical protein
MMKIFNDSDTIEIVKTKIIHTYDQNDANLVSDENKNYGIIYEE